MGKEYDDAAIQKLKGRGHSANTNIASINWLAWLQHIIVGPDNGMFSNPITLILRK